jgi:hypothetical protein
VDGSAHCFACGYHQHAKRYLPKVKEQNDAEKAVLPRDFTREVPAKGWKWLLQYGLPYSYWKPYTGYSPAEDRLILTVGSPVQFSIGRYLGPDANEGRGGERGRSVRLQGKAGDVLPVSVGSHRKWKLWGDRHRYAEVLGLQNSGAYEGVVLVEDIISAHKVAQVAPALALFGTDIHKTAIQTLRSLKRPIALWLDEDMYGDLPRRINRLTTFLNVPVTFIRKRKDPKEYSLDEIKGILSAKEVL